jgi:glyceraldehyde 3-phosphate dehydrogenase
MTEELYKLNLCPAKIDVGKLTHEWIDQKNNFKNHSEFLKNKLDFLIKNPDLKPNPKDVVLFGFGRIGRLCARELIKQAGKGQQLRLRAIVIRSIDEKSLQKRASLLIITR